jgi:hypothetical protein
VKTPPQDKSTPAQSPSGGVRHDERGHAVWQWATDTARNAINSTSAMLRKLEVPGLSLQDEEPPSKTRASARGASEEKQGYTAYVGQRAETAKPATARATNAPTSAKTRPAKTSLLPRAPSRRSWWRRLLGRD